MSSPATSPSAAALLQRPRTANSALSRCVLALLLLAPVTFGVRGAHAQASAPTASRKLDLQVGGFYVWAPKPDYTDHSFSGGGGFVALDFTKLHLGGEIDIHQVGTSDLSIYERTYEGGVRYSRHYGRIIPFVRGSFGRGVFNFPNNVANIAYNLFAVGGGADVIITRHVTGRVDIDSQHWSNFPGHGSPFPTNGLTPTLVSFGGAYHF